ncbi:protein of unknown function [Cyanobium sp. NIES-981]|nr:protein of unknown function [Cyanobium sp. NIES-981]
MHTFRIASYRTVVRRRIDQLDTRAQEHVVVSNNVITNSCVFQTGKKLANLSRLPAHKTMNHNTTACAALLEGLRQDREDVMEEITLYRYTKTLAL